MENIVLLILCFSLGIFFRRIEKFPVNAHVSLNAFIIYVSLPATVLYYIHGLTLNPELIFLALMPWIIFILAFPFFLAAARIFSFNRSTTGALILTAGFGNTSFVGLPMIEAFFGKEFLGYGIVADQPGSFLALSTLGIMAAVRFSTGNISPGQMTKRIVLFPPFVAIGAALLLFSVPYPDWANTILLRLSDTLAPLALLSVGLQIRFRAIKGRVPPLLLGLFFKMVLAPAVIFILYSMIPGIKRDLFHISIFEAAMAPMITAGIVAADHDLDPELSALMLGIGIPFSFLTLPVWYWFLLL